MASLGEPPIPSLIRGLASCDASIRSKTIKTLITYLPSQTLISDDDFKKIWKSLFYCMWHSDKSENQSHLINLLSSLLLTLSPEVSVSYFSHFLLTMRREWPGIDHLRLDKFYLLVRFFVRNMFVLLNNVKWDLVVLEGFVGVLEKRVFFVDDSDDKGLGNGVTYHVVSVFFDELKPFLPLRLEILELLFRPLIAVFGRSDNKVLVGKVKNHVFDCLIKNGKGLLEIKKSGCEVDEKDDVVLFGTVGLCMGFAAKFYELGSGLDCVQGNRKVLFALHEEFSKLEKEKESLGVHVLLPKDIVDGEDDDDDDEVPQLVPINGQKMDEVSKVKASKSNGESKKSKDKKSKKKKKKKSEGSSGCGGNIDTEMTNSNDNSSNIELEEDMDALELSENAISNLQKQFEKIAEESGLDGGCVSAIESSPTVQVKGKAKKRKRSKSAVKVDMGSKEEADEEKTVPKTEEKSVKRVRFSMKNNLVWKPQTPLPPQSLRIPPSSTPRGSALKKGLSPGPVRDTNQDSKKSKKKKASPMRKARKVKSISPAIKRVKKVKPTSA